MDKDKTKEFEFITLTNGGDTENVSFSVAPCDIFEENTRELCEYFNAITQIKEIAAKERSLAESRYNTNKNSRYRGEKEDTLLDELSMAREKHELVTAIECELVERIINNLKKKYITNA